jgi:hypothetical protein
MRHGCINTKIAQVPKEKILVASDLATVKLSNEYGTSIKFLKTCVILICLVIQQTQGCLVGLSLNSNELLTNIEAINPGNCLRLNGGITPNYLIRTADIMRVHTNGMSSFTATLAIIEHK